MSSANRNRARLNVFASSSSSSSNSEQSDATNAVREKRRKKREKRWLQKKKKVKSGKDAKVYSYILKSELWPHAHINPIPTFKKEIKYEDLTLEQFVVEYCSILSQRKLPTIDREAHIEHLSQLMYLAMAYKWLAVLN